MAARRNIICTSYNRPDASELQAQAKVDSLPLHTSITADRARISGLRRGQVSSIACTATEKMARNTNALRVRRLADYRVQGQPSPPTIRSFRLGAQLL